MCFKHCNKFQLLRLKSFEILFVQLANFLVKQPVMTQKQVMLSIKCLNLICDKRFTKLFLSIKTLKKPGKKVQVAVKEVSIADDFDIDLCANRV